MPEPAELPPPPDEPVAGDGLGVGLVACVLGAGLGAGVLGAGALGALLLLPGLAPDPMTPVGEPAAGVTAGGEAAELVTATVDTAGVADTTAGATWCDLAGRTGRTWWTG